MLTTGGQRPQGLNPFTDSVFRVLEAFVVSPWGVLKLECSRGGLDPLNLDEGDLEALLPRLRAHVARLTDGDHADHAEASLRDLLAPPPVGGIAPYG